MILFIGFFVLVIICMIGGAIGGWKDSKAQDAIIEMNKRQKEEQEKR